jgi:hypothetical protein
MNLDPRLADEESVHGAVVELLRLKAHRDLIYFHPANGGERRLSVALRLKRMGVVAGVPDLAFVLPDGRAAFLEVKTRTGRMSPEQMMFAARCKAVGTPFAIARSVDEAERVLASWGALRVRQAA